MTARTYLYVPADQDRMVARSGERGADSVILDLEDSVAAASKNHARDVVRQVLQGSLPLPAPLVRVNHMSHDTADVRADLLAAVWPGLVGIVVPKAEEPETLGRLDGLLSELEAARGMANRSVAVIPLIESALGLEQLRAFAGGPRVVRLQLGERDLIADLGMEPGPDESELLPWRSLLVAVSRANGLDPPVGSAEPDIRDLRRLEESTRRLRRLGFAGRTAIHPSQIAVIRSVFAPSDTDAARAQAVLDSYEQAAANGLGVTRGPDGVMVDAAIARSARQLLSKLGQDRR